MIFSDLPSQKALERMMTQVKGFLPRGSGVMVLRRFEYTAEMCDCRLCLYYNRKKKCTVSQCLTAKRKESPCGSTPTSMQRSVSTCGITA